MTLGLLHVDLLSGLYCCLESNASCCGGGRLIVAVSCGRKQIRIWIVLRGEAQQFPSPPLQTPPTPAVHKHTLQYFSSLFGGRGGDKQLYIFSICLPNEIDNMHPCDALPGGN